MKQKLIFKSDKYRSARGGYSRILNIHCRKCNEFILAYQKDGPGNLRRLYFDRIVYPKNYIGLEKKNLSLVVDLNCKGCKELLGLPYIYTKEKRKAFKLFQDSVVKKIRRLDEK